MIAITYTYRDASNYKQHQTVRLSGTLTPDQIERVRATLDVDDRFIPGQIGIPFYHLGTGMDAFPGEDDHPWHELDLDGIEEVGDIYAAHMDAEKFVAAFESAASAGWDDGYYFDSLGV